MFGAARGPRGADRSGHCRAPSVRSQVIDEAGRRMDTPALHSEVACHDPAHFQGDIRVGSRTTSGQELLIRDRWETPLESSAGSFSGHDRAIRTAVRIAKISRTGDIRTPLRGRSQSPGRVRCGTSFRQVARFEHHPDSLLQVHNTWREEVSFADGPNLLQGERATQRSPHTQVLQFTSELETEADGPLVDFARAAEIDDNRMSSRDC